MDNYGEMIIIKEKDDIENYQHLFSKIIQYKIPFYKDTWASWADRKKEEEKGVFWSDDLEFWSTSNLYDVSTGNKSGYRYRNWFGFSNPKERTTVEVNVEISFSLPRDGKPAGTSGGKFVLDGNKIFVVHDGNITMNITDEDKKVYKNKKVYFMDRYKNQYNGKTITINNKEFAKIGELPLIFNEKQYSSFQNSVKTFINIAKEIKNNNQNNGNGDGGSKTLPKNIQTPNAINPTPLKENNILHKSINDDRLDVINKSFRLILPVLAKYICKIFIEKDKNNWWRKYVLSKLKNENTVRKLPKEGFDDECIESLDIPACLNIIENNWVDVFKYKMDDRQRTWSHVLYDIRNYCESHYTTKTLKTSVEDISLELAIMVRFMRPIDPDVADEISEMRKAFENKYKNE